MNVINIHHKTYLDFLYKKNKLGFVMNVINIRHKNYLV